jgi:peptidylprolyl isomerase
MVDRLSIFKGHDRILIIKESPLKEKILWLGLVFVLTACGGAAQPEAAATATKAVAVVATDTPLPSEAPTEVPATTEAAAAAATEEVEVVSEIAEEDIITTESGLQYVMVEEGGGDSPEPGSMVQVHYTGTLEDGTKFDSSYDRGEPIQFMLSAGQVIPGWDEGIALLKVGGKAKLIIPPELAYGASGAGGVIPPDATLLFDVELVGVEPAPPPPPEAPTEVAEADLTETESGLKYYDFVVGEGTTPQPGQQIQVHYTGWLESNGTMFDSSLLRGRPFEFVVGVGQVIPGWDEGLLSMKAGGKRQLIIPAELAYGERGAGNVIPANSVLIFEIELLEVR